MLEWMLSDNFFYFFGALLVPAIYLSIRHMALDYFAKQKIKRDLKKFGLRVERAIWHKDSRKTHKAVEVTFFQVDIPFVNINNSTQETFRTDVFVVLCNTAMGHRFKTKATLKSWSGIFYQTTYEPDLQDLYQRSLMAWEGKNIEDTAASACQ